MNESETESEGGGPVASVKFNLMPPKFRLHRDVIFTLEDLFGSCFVFVYFSIFRLRFILIVCV